MNRLELLPKELCNYIYFLRDTNAIIKIQKRWQKYRAPKIIAMTLACGCYSQYESLPDISSPHTANVMEYMLNVLSGKEKGWHSFFIDMEEVLLRDEYMGGPGAIYYDRIERAYMRIKKKFTNLNYDKLEDEPSEPDIRELVKKIGVMLLRVRRGE